MADDAAVVALSTSRRASLSDWSTCPISSSVGSLPSVPSIRPLSATFMGRSIILVAILPPEDGYPTKVTKRHPGFSRTSHGTSMLTSLLAVKRTATWASPLTKTARQLPRPVHSSSNETFSVSDSMPFWMMSSRMGCEMTRSLTVME